MIATAEQAASSYLRVHMSVLRFCCNACLISRSAPSALQQSLALEIFPGLRNCANEGQRVDAVWRKDAAHLSVVHISILVLELFC